MALKLGLGLGMGISARSSDTGGVSISSWAGLRDLNDTNLAAMTFTLSDDVSAWGDSLTAGAASGNTGSASWVPEMSANITNTLNNEGVGGQTSDEILARILAAPASQRDDVSVVMWGTNNGAGGSYEAPNIIADYDAADLALTGPHVFVGGFQTLPFGASEGNGVASKDVWRHLRDSYPDHSISLWAAMCREIADDPAAETALVQGHFEPLQISSSNLHWADASGLRKDATRALAAVDGAGPPMVAEEELPARYVVGSAPGAIIHRFRCLGVATSWAIVGGNDDGAFAINSAGELLTTATPFADDFREVFVEARNANGVHYGRLIVGRAAADGDYSLATRCRTETGGYYYHGDAEPREFSIAMLVRHNGGGRLFQSNACAFRSTSAGAFTGVFRATDASSQNTANISPGAGWHWVMASWRIDAATAENGLITYGHEGGVASKVPTTTAPLSFDAFSSLLTNGINYSLASDVDLRAMWVAHEFVDWTDQSNRDALFNSATLDPVAPANGVFAGITPQVWMHGGPGDWASGHNRGSHDVHMIPTVDVARAKYESAAA